MITPGWIVAALTPAIDAALALDPEAHHRLEGLEGRVLQLRVTGLDCSVYAIPEHGHLRLAGVAPEQGVAACIAGPPASLAMLAGRSGTQILFSGSLHVDGDIEAAKAYKRLFDTLDPDWEEALARAVGDIPAHEAGRVLRGLAAQGRRAWSGRRADLHAWLVDEIEALPARSEVEDWLGAVDRLRADGDRLAARVARLERRGGTRR